MIARLPDWPLRFDAYLMARMLVPFAWGAQDCALFAAGAVEAVTGIDFARGLRGHGSALQAARTLRRLGGLRQVASRALGPACEPKDATQGDVLLVEQGGRELLAVCLDDKHAVAPTSTGLGCLSRASAVAAWRVG